MKLAAGSASQVSMASSATSLFRSERYAGALRRIGPGVALSVALAVAAVLVAPLLGPIFPIPAMVIALLLGIAMNRIASRAAFEPGIAWCVRRLLRVAIALLGIRIAIGDIVGLGLSVALLVVIAMALTVVSGFWLARVFQLDVRYGALAGAATAVCGASATLATATVVPNYAGKSADVTFTVVAANGVSTIVMLLYPPLAALIGFGAQTTGVMLGATIHDMAQVVGAAYAVSEPVGNAAVIVKLFRVFLLLPVVVAIGWWFLREGGETGKATVPVPVFAVVFLVLCFINSIASAVPDLVPIYASLKALLVTASNGGLLVAIAALGLGTSLGALLRIGWRHVAVFSGTTLTILLIITSGLLVLR
jgi:uncharacterized integral membrane protein (TIGR00698 family)